MTSALLAFWLLAAPPVVRDGGAALRDSCSPDGSALIRLDAGTPVEIRSAMQGEAGTCYRVRAAGRDGYLLPSEIAGADSFEKARRDAADVMPQMIRSEISSLRQSIQAQPAGSLGEALKLLESSQPREALQVIESSLLRTQSSDPTVLAIAGIAAYQSDRVKEAVEYWSRSLALRPNPSIEALYRRAQREAASDTNLSRLHSPRFLLRYDERQIAQPAAAAILQALDAAYGRIDTALGCGIQEQIAVIVETDEAYRRSSGAEDWSGGQFDGRIHIALPDRTYTPRVQQTLAHELVHACLARNGRFPLWFHEGMAQRWSGEQPSLSAVAAARTQLAARRMPDLAHLNVDFIRVSTENARIAYALSAAAVDALYQGYGEQYVRNLLRSPESLESAAAAISRQFAAVGTR